MSGYVSGFGALNPSTMRAGPQTAGLIQRYYAMTPEQLQQTVAMLGTNTPLGQMASAILNAKLTMPNVSVVNPNQSPYAAGAPQGPMMGAVGTSTAPTAPMSPLSASAGVPSAGTPAAAEAAPTIAAPFGGVQSGFSTPTFGGMMPNMPGGAGVAPYRRGGHVPPRLAYGGWPLGMSLSMANPWWERREARPDSGLIHSTVPGRTDHVAAAPMVDSYVIPADVVAGLGEGNTLAGAKVLTMALNTGPYGTPREGGFHRDTIPRPPRAEYVPSPFSYFPGEEAMLSAGLVGDGGIRGAMAHGGRAVRDGHPETTRIFAAGGEFIIPPEKVREIGGGDIREGHRILDEFVRKVREKTIRQMKNLKGPVK